MNYLHRLKSSLTSALVQFGSISIEQFIILTIACTVLVMGVILLRYILFNRKMNLKNLFALLCLIVYVNIIAQLTLLGRKHGSRIGVDLTFSNIRGTEHSSSIELLCTYSFLNVFLFVPYGVIISLFSFIERKKCILQVFICLLITISTSLGIEVLQYVTQRGYFELDDLLCNTFGGLIGSILIIFIRSLIKKTRTNSYYEEFR